MKSGANHTDHWRGMQHGMSHYLRFTACSGRDTMARMNMDMVAAQEFESIRNGNETVLWAGRPAHWPYLASGIPFLAIGCIWFSIDYFGFIRPMLSGTGKMPGGFAGFAIPFFMLHLFPFWASILNMVRLVFVWKNAAYALTDKRLMFREGFWGISYDSIDHDQITDLQVNIGPIERMCGVGSVSVNAGRTNSKGNILRQTFTAIEEPYDVYKEIKRVSLDIKSDLEYPNKLRPAENPGYKTAYTGK